jgi:hypothetical protein
VAVRLLCFALFLAACDGAPLSDAGTADVPTGTFCADSQRLLTCDGSACTEARCRGDELCESSACVPWLEADLFADFVLTQGVVTPSAISVRVSPYGFPRAQVESLRFTFGDGVAGFGEVLSHQYLSPGVYPVELEVRLSGHRVLRARKLAVVEPGPDHNPLSLTIDEIPAYLNGSIPLTRNGGTPDDPSDDVQESFMLLTPRHGFSVDVAILDDPADPIDRSSLSLRASAAMGDREAGSELASELELTDDAAPRAQWIVPPASAAESGLVRLTLSARTAAGRAHERTLVFETTELTAARDPFDRPLTWLFHTESDFFTTRVTAREGTRFELASETAPNGVPDLVEELALLGAQGSDDALNAIYLGWIRERIVTETYRYFGIGPDGVAHDGISFAIVWEGAPGAPDPATFSPTGEFSMMRFGGVFDGALGYSGFGPWNEERVDDSGPERGIATAELFSILLSTPVATTAFDPIKPESGVPLGEHPADAAVLDPDFDPYADHGEGIDERYAELRGIARYLALAIASVTAHEMGHAMGLVPNGVPPDGFFGGIEDVSFIGAARTDSHHADLPGLNLMQSGGDYLGVIDEAIATVELPRGANLLLLAEILALENRLGPYDRAYLQRRLTHLSF